MPVDYLSQIKPLEDAGKTDAEIVAAILPLCHKAVPLGDLLFLMNERGMLTRRHRNTADGEKWMGSVPAMLDAVNAGGTDEQKALVNQWFSHITNDRNEVFSLNKSQYAAGFALITSSFGGQPGMPTVADFDAIRGLAGGLIAPTFDQTALDALRAEHAATEAANARRQAALAAYQTTVRGKINAADAAAKAAYQSADYSQAIDHAAAVIAAADIAYNA